jgi:hypothetical protein
MESRRFFSLADLIHSPDLMPYCVVRRHSPLPRVRLMTSPAWLAILDELRRVRVSRTRAAGRRPSNFMESLV